jgi:hypothetical protein
VELDLIELDTPICTSHSKPLWPLLIVPQYSIGTAHNSVLDRNVLRQLFNAPDIDIRVQRCRSTMLRVGCPREGVYTGGVEGPTTCYGLQKYVQTEVDRWQNSATFFSGTSYKTTLPLDCMIIRLYI